MTDFKRGDRFYAEIVFTEDDSDGDPMFTVEVEGESVAGFYITRTSETLDTLLPIKEYSADLKKQFADLNKIEEFLS